MKTKLLLTFFITCMIVGCSHRNPVEDAKAVLISHEQFSKAGDLEGIMSNMAEDVIFLAPGIPLLKGKEACRNFYNGMLKMGKTEFTHNYDGAEIIGDAVILHGLATGTTTMPDSSVIHFANNFIITVKYQHDGKMKLWRGAFAPSSQ